MLIDYIYIMAEHCFEFPWRWWGGWVSFVIKLYHHLSKLAHGV